MFRKLLAALVLAASVFIAAPASAALNPTINLYGNQFSAPGAYRLVFGTITLGSSDTYVTGGITITPAQVGLTSYIAAVDFGPSLANFLPTYSVSSSNAVVKFNALLPSSSAAIVSGAGNIAATATTATVTGLSGLTANTPIFCQLDDAATGGGGTGTWAVTAAVASCKYASASSITITSTAAAPTGGGNFTYWIGSAPTITNTASNSELANGTSVANVVIPFIVAGY